MSFTGHLDCSTGVSGDKFLGALLDAGSCGGLFTESHLQEILSRIAPEARVVVSMARSHGIAATTVRVEATTEPPSRTWADVRALIEGASLPNDVACVALAAFEELAGAEAAAHDVPADRVHFHEVGALDSILDIIGVAAGVNALGIERLFVSPLALGWGTVSTSHGELSVPAPATAHLVTCLPTGPGRPRPDGTAPGELTTPTGAALVRVLACGFGACPPITPRLLGYGAGTRDLGMPNVCRLVAGEDSAYAMASLARENVTLLEANIDHISPEAAAFSADQLMAEGALDVWVTPIVMKKSRAALMLSALVRTDDAEHHAARLSALTGSLGVRVTDQPRLIASRSERLVDTPYGMVRFKEGAGRLRAESDDVARIATTTGRPFTELAEELARFAEERGDTP